MKLHSILLLLGYNIIVFSSCASQPPSPTTTTTNGQQFLQALTTVKQKKLTPIIPIITNFKAVLQRFLAFPWQTTPRQLTTPLKDQAASITNDLNTAYARIAFNDLLASVTLLGSYHSTNQLSSQAIKQLQSIFEELQKAENKLHDQIPTYHEQYKKLLSNLLAFATLSPSPQQVIERIIKELEINHTVVNDFVIIAQALVLGNTKPLEQHVHTIIIKERALKTAIDQTTATIKQLLKDTVVIDITKKDISPLLDNASQQATIIEQYIHELTTSFLTITLCIPFTTSLTTLKRWNDMAKSLETKLASFIAQQKAWRQELHKLMEETNIYNFLKNARLGQSIHDTINYNGMQLSNFIPISQTAQQEINKQVLLLTTNNNIPAKL